MLVRNAAFSDSNFLCYPTLSRPGDIPTQDSTAGKATERKRETLHSGLLPQADLLALGVQLVFCQFENPF